MSISEQPHGPDAVKQVVLSRLFVDHVAPSFRMHGLLDTQRRKIGELTTVLANEHPAAASAVARIASRNMTDGTEMDLWGGLSDLMLAAEDVTGDSYRYTPAAFVDSLAPFAESEVSKFTAHESVKARHASLWPSFGLTEAQRTRLKREADHLLRSPRFVAEHSAQYFHTAREYDADDGANNRVYSRQRTVKATIVGDYLSGTGNTSVLDGMMRSDVTCRQQSTELISHHDETDGVTLLHGIGGNTFAYTHEAAIALPNQQTKDLLYGLQGTMDFAIVSFEGARYPMVPPLGDLTIVDPTVLQHFENPFLDTIPYANRVAFADSISPGSFSETGIFVDTYRNYIRFLGHIGVATPRFRISK